MSDDPNTPGWASPGGKDEPARDPWGNPLPEGGQPPPDYSQGPPPGHQQPTPGQSGPQATPQWEQPLSQWGSPSPAPAWSGGGHYPGQEKTEGTAIGALVCAIVGLCICGIVLEPVAIVLGIMARRKIRDSNGTLKGDGLALAAIIIGIIGFVIGVASTIFLLANPDFLDDLTTTTR
jgi:hypothetical protein